MGNQDSADLLGVILGYNAGFSAKRINLTPTTVSVTQPWTGKAIAPVSSADSDTPVARCSNCLYRAALAGKGPLADMFKTTDDHTAN